MPKQEQTKRFFWIALNTALVVLVILMVFATKALWRYGASVVSSRTINISAEGKVITAPDVALLSFSVVSQGEDPEAIQTENTEKINQALEFVKQQGVEEKDIKTSNYNLSPRYEYDKIRRTNEIIGYTLNQTISLKIRDLEKAGTILGGLPSRGVNQVGSLRFDIDDPDKFLNEAREEAFTKAFEKAKTMANLNGTKIRRVVSFSESSGGFPMPFFERAMADSAIGGAPAPLPSVEPGSQEVTVRVNVVYEIW